MTSRLYTIAADLDDELKGRPPDQLRKAATAAALLAVDRVQLADPRLDEALAAIRESVPGTGDQCSTAFHVAEELDELAWDIQERVDAGALSERAYAQAFERARAAASISIALGPDPLEAAREAMYEAQAAIGDLAAIRTAVCRALTS